MLGIDADVAEGPLVEAGELAARHAAAAPLAQRRDDRARIRLSSRVAPRPGNWETVAAGCCLADARGVAPCAATRSEAWAR